MAAANVTKTLTIGIQVLKLGEGFVAVANPGGVRVRGAMMQDELNAVRNLLIVMGNAQSDSDIGLSLEIEGSDFGEMMGTPKELGGGVTDTTSGGDGGPDGG